MTLCRSAAAARLVASLLALSTVCAWSAAAGQGIDPADWKPDSTHPASYAQVRARYAEQLDVYDYPTVFRALVRELDASATWSKSEPIFRKLREAMDTVVRRFDGFERDLTGANAVGTAVDSFLGRYATGLFQQTGEQWFTEPFVVTFDEVQQLTREKGNDFLHRRDAVERLLTEFRRPARERALAAIVLADQRWTAFIEQGRSQYPWEAFINGRGPLRVRMGIERPPMRQWIFLHPELGVEVDTRGTWLREATAKESLLLQLFGHVWYRWKDAAIPSKGLRWWGLSAAALLRDDLGPGFGLTALYGPTVTLGAMWHDDDRDDEWLDEPPRVVIGIDLYRLARREGTEVRRMLANRKELFARLGR